MNVFADTSGLFALLVRNDYMYVRAKENFTYFAQNQVRLITSSFVLVETIALLQRRVGIESVHDFAKSILPVLDIIWADSSWYDMALRRLLMLNRRDISLVDCLSFEIMDYHHIHYAFSFDKHFQDQGFSLAKFHSLP